MQMKLAPPEQMKLVFLEQLATDKAYITKFRSLNEGGFCLEFSNGLFFESTYNETQATQPVETLAPGRGEQVSVVNFWHQIEPLGPKNHPGYYELTFSNDLVLRGNVWGTGIQNLGAGESDNSNANL